MAAEIRRPWRRLDAPEVAEGFGRDAPGLREALGGALREIEFSVRRPRVSVIRVLEIPQVGIDLDVFVRPIVAIEVAHDGQIGRVADPQVASVPGKPLDGIQAGGKCPGGVSDPVTIGIDQHDDRVAGRIRLGIPHCGPCPTNRRPRASNAMAPGFRTMGSRAKSSTFNSEGTVGSEGTAAD